MDKEERTLYIEKIRRYDDLEKEIKNKKNNLKMYQEMTLGRMTFNFTIEGSMNSRTGNVPINLRQLIKSSIIAITSDEIEELEKELINL